MNATLEQWKALFQAAEQFKQAACWKWMDNSHIFGVEDPISKEIGYCCIMGNGGEMYGITVYRGTRGLDSYIEVASGETDEMQYTQDCLMLSFDSRDDLHPEEYKRIKELGLKFRGAHAWPTFRLYEPGYYPWPIEEWEHVQFLTHALHQAIVVSRDYRSDPDALHEHDGERILTRVSAAEDDANLAWSDQWLTPKPVDNESTSQFKVDELRLAKIKKSLEGITEAWVMDCFYMPFPVKEGGRPYFPMMFLLADRSSGQILHFHLFEGTTATEEIAEQFLNLIEQLKLIPKEILIIRESAVEYLESILDTLNIEVYIVEHEPLLEEIKNGLMGSFRQ